MNHAKAQVTQRLSHIVQHQQRARPSCTYTLTAKKTTYVSEGERGSVLPPLLSDYMTPGQMSLSKLKIYYFPTC